MLLNCFQKLVGLVTQILNFILLIPDECSRKKIEDSPSNLYALESGLGERVALPWPRGHQPGLARLRNHADRHAAEAPTVNPHAPKHVRPGSPEVRVRKSIGDKKEMHEAVKEKLAADTSLGLRGSQPLVHFLGESSAGHSSLTTVAPHGLDPFGVGVASDLTVTTEADGSPSHNTANLPLIVQSDLTFVKQIGGGGFGQVWQGIWRGTPVAIKVLSIPAQAEPTPHSMAAFEEEVGVLERLRHPNICLLLGVCWDAGQRAIITELVSRGSLWDALRAPLGVNSDGVFFWPRWLLRRVLEGAGRGLIYLHRHNPPIIHRDLKSPNLLLDDSFNVKICDFGLARLRDISRDSVLTANVGTVQWMAPEVVSGGHYDETVDVYSMGLVAWEMMTGKCPYENMKQMEIALAVVNSRLRPKIPINCNQAQYYFLQRCWAANPQDRFSAEDFTSEVAKVFNTT